jgi:hypothetical protein
MCSKTARGARGSTDVPGVFTVSSPPPPSLRTAKEGTGDDKAAAQINREAEEVPQGQQQDRDAQRPQHDLGDPSDDEDPSDNNQLSSDSDDNVSDVDQDNAARP